MSICRCVPVLGADCTYDVLIEVQDVLYNADFARDQVETLEAAVRDAMKLHKLHGSSHDVSCPSCMSLLNSLCSFQFAVAQADFPLKQYELQGVALRDNAALQNSAPGSQLKVGGQQPRYG